MRITHIMNGTRPVHKRARHTLGLAFAASTLTILGAFSISTMASAQEVSPQSIKLAESNQTKSPSALKPSVMVTGRLSSTFGTAPDPFKKGSTRNHWGVDVAAPIGTPIYSPADGVIMAATDSYNGNPKYGNVVALQTDGGMLTVFAHLDGYTVRTGQRVTKGTEIATVGNSGKSTGPHVHIETYRNGSRVDPASVWDISLN